ncbi:MAG: exodeoxyribonuclease VII small subunit [Cellvibrionaceae bacterium]|jgi:exodeoxyribonuclease VII small subunit
MHLTDYYFWPFSFVKMVIKTHYPITKYQQLNPVSEEIIKVKSKKLNFEQSLAELDKLVGKLEDGELSLEESLTAFERGINLTKECQLHLSEAEQKVSLLVGEGDNLSLADFDEAENKF